jgi:quercetin dioxygenase-like cupin family protein
MLAQPLNCKLEEMAMNTKGFVTLPGQQPVWNIAPGRTATLKLQTNQTGESVMVFEEVAPAGTETPLHLHHHSDEVMCVLSGQFTFKLGEGVTNGGAGACIFMPRGIPHAWKNTGADTGRALFIYTPAEAGKFFEEFARLQRPFSLDDPEMEQILHRAGSENVGPPPF